jgi:Holliday junction resolvase RusA-like endonuclease
MVYKAVIPLNPVTKKNSQRICINNRTGKRFVKQSKRYEEYEDAAGYFLKSPEEPIDFPVNLKCIFYRRTKHRVDLSNLIEAIQDILVKCGVLEDDNHTIVQGLDGCRVEFDKENPRTEIEITPK